MLWAMSAASWTRHPFAATTTLPGCFPTPRDVAGRVEARCETGWAAGSLVADDLRSILDRAGPQPSRPDQTGRRPRDFGAPGMAPWLVVLDLPERKLMRSAVWPSEQGRQPATLTAGRGGATCFTRQSQ